MRRVVEDMTKVAVTPGTGNFGPDHAIRDVGSQLDTIAGLGSVECRPAAARIEFRFGMEQLLPASSAAVDSCFEVVIVFV